MTEVSSTISNYCVCFIDILGQRHALKDQGLLPAFSTDEERAAFLDIAKKCIGPIVALQDQAETMVRAAVDPRESEFRTKLQEEHRAIWDEMQKTRVTKQHWSDGLVSFVSLGDREIKCPMNAVYSLFVLAGSLCLIGLASQSPLRGAIDTAWAIELREGELYGAALARAYELESEVAQYPRIVVGPRTIGYLEAMRNVQNGDVFAENNRGLAELCLNMLIEDADGHWILHYLGEEFRDTVSRDQHVELYQKALEFVFTELEKHRRGHDTKLAFRYGHLLQYFLAHHPAASDSVQ